MNLLFSIVVPSYNRAHLIPVIIESVLHQTCKAFELIIVDDGSKDNTREVVEKYAEVHTNIRYIYQENKERGAARNNGIRNAKGDFVLLIDSDDELLPNGLEILKTTIEQHSDFDFFAYKFKFKDGQKIMPSPIEEVDQHILDYKFFLHGNPLGCNVCFRKSNPTLVLFEEDRHMLAEDWVFIIKNLYRKKLFLTHEIGLYMHQHQNRSMQQNQFLIESRQKATRLLCNTLNFSQAEQNEIWAYSYYFCSIHAYLDANRKQSIDFIRKSIGLLGWNKLFTRAYIKYLLGRNSIMAIKHFLGK